MSFPQNGDHAVRTASPACCYLPAQMQLAGSDRWPYLIINKELMGLNYLNCLL